MSMRSTFFPKSVFTTEAQRTQRFQLKEEEAGQGMKEKTVGIIGGLGPEATVDLMRRVIQATPAGDDQDHIRMIVDCNPKVPSRMKAILEGTGENPAPYLVTMAKDLAAWGADFLVIACNTAHLYFDRIQEAVPIPVLNMIDLTVDHVVTENPAIRKAGLLASWTVIRPGLYEAAFEKRGVALLHPSPCAPGSAADRHPPDKNRVVMGRRKGKRSRRPGGNWWIRGPKP